MGEKLVLVMDLKIRQSGAPPLLGASMEILFGFWGKGKFLNLQTPQALNIPGEPSRREKPDVNMENNNSPYSMPTAKTHFC